MAEQQDLELEDREAPAANEPREQAPPERPKLEVDLGEDGGDDRKTRRGRMRELRETLKTERTARENLEKQIAELQGHVRGLGQFQQQTREDPRQREADPDSDPVEVQINGYWAQQQAILAQLRNPEVSGNEASKLEKEWQKLDRKRVALISQHAVAPMINQRPQESDEAHANRILRADFPEVFENEVRRQEAILELHKLVERGAPVSLATARRAAQLVKDRYVRRAPTPTAAEKAKHTSSPGRAAGSAGSKFAPSKLQLNSAKAFTAHLDDLSDEQRVRIWAKKVGRKLDVR